MINAFPSMRIVDEYFIGQVSSETRILVFTSIRVSIHLL